ncbi:MAG: L-lactate permease [Pirellulales bacterium]
MCGDPAIFWRFADELAPTENAAQEPLRVTQTISAWVPWVLLSVMVFLWALPSVKGVLNGIGSYSFEVPGLHNVVFRTSPVAPVPDGATHAAEAEKAIYEFSWLATTGTGIFLAAILSGFWLRLSLATIASEFVMTLWKMRWALLTIACMLALAFVTKYCGSDATLGLAFTHTGRLYPFFAPLLGWLGVALTGSDTSSNALFGGLQRVTAEQLGFNSYLIVGSNSTGGVMGKMIDAQSIVVAAVATNQSGSEGRILRFVFVHSLALAGLVGVLTFLQAYWLKDMIPPAH